MWFRIAGTVYITIMYSVQALGVLCSYSLYFLCVFDIFDSTVFYVQCNYYTMYLFDISQCMYLMYIL